MEFVSRRFMRLRGVASRLLADIDTKDCRIAGLQIVEKWYMILGMCTHSCDIVYMARRTTIELDEELLGKVEACHGKPEHPRHGRRSVTTRCSPSRECAATSSGRAGPLL